MCVCVCARARVHQVYVYDTPNGTSTVEKANDTIAYNWMLANYHSSMAIDNDDGSSSVRLQRAAARRVPLLTCTGCAAAQFDTHHNVLIAAASGAAYGGNSLKSDFGGNSNFHHDNLDLFWSKGFGICTQLAGHEDGYYNNYLWIGQDGDYGDGQTCSGAGTTFVKNNTVWSPTGEVDALVALCASTVAARAGKLQECGMTLQQWQAKGGDAGTMGSPYPADAVVLNLARTILGL